VCTWTTTWLCQTVRPLALVSTSRWRNVRSQFRWRSVAGGRQPNRHYRTHVYVSRVGGSEIRERRGQRGVQRSRGRESTRLDLPARGISSRRGIPRLADAGGGESRGHGQTRQHTQGISWIPAVIDEIDLASLLFNDARATLAAIGDLTARADRLPRDTSTSRSEFRIAHRFRRARGTSK
jgi:hypothetical protein